MSKGQAPSGFGRIANIFMIVAFAVGIFYIVGFIRLYPEYWFAAVIFLIIAIAGIVRRIAVLRGVLPPTHTPGDDAK